jgi:TRAP transporter TAXI family solute receptor
LSVGFAPIIGKYVDIKASSQAGYMSEANIHLLREGEADLTWATANAVFPAWNGKAPFDWPQVYLRQIHSGHVGTLTWVTRADSDIKTPADFRGKRIIAWSPTSMAMQGTVESTLWAYGLTKDDIDLVTFTGHKAYLEAFKEKRADAAMSPGAIPTAGLIELFAQVPSRIVPIGDAEMAKIHDKWPYWFGATVPTGTYKGQNEEALIHGILASVLAHKDLPEDLVYEITKALMEHPDEVTAVHPAARYYTLDNFFNNPMAPFHSGSVKYYKEKGVWTPEMEEFQNKLLGKK